MNLFQVGNIKWYVVLLVCFCVIGLHSGVYAGEIVFAENGQVGYTDTPKQPWSRWLVHDLNRPAPAKITLDPKKIYFAPAPPDATVLFSGSNLDAWKPNEKWVIRDGVLECGGGALTTKDSYGDFQLHLEFRSPANFNGPWGNQGNNGVILFGSVEIQIFDNFTVNSYADGLCGSVYGQTPPLVNACLPPGNWQAYDIYFRAPRYDASGSETEQARVTINFNGVLVQNNTPVYGGTGHACLPSPFKGRKSGTISFSGHGCPVQFRNVWIRPLGAESGVDEKTQAVNAEGKK